MYNVAFRIITRVLKYASVLNLESIKGLLGQEMVLFK